VIFFKLRLRSKLLNRLSKKSDESFQSFSKISKEKNQDENGCRENVDSGLKSLTKIHFFNLNVVSSSTNMNVTFAIL
jgi:hypothetical protein